MTDQLPVSLDDLKRAIAAIPGYETPHSELDEARHDLKFAQAQWEAWRTAFEWRNKWASTVTVLASQPEFIEGMRLIREHLR